MKVQCYRCDRAVRIPDGIDPRLTFHTCRPPRETLRWRPAFSAEELKAEQRLAWARSQLGGALEDAVGSEAILRWVDE